MFDANKIHSLINSGDSKIPQIAKGINISYSTLKSKLKADSWTPSDLEKIAIYFKKPISYFFENEELAIVNESGQNYNTCPECEKKLQEIEKIRAEKDDVYRRYVECLEELCGKKEKSA